MAESCVPSVEHLLCLPGHIQVQGTTEDLVLWDQQVLSHSSSHFFPVQGNSSGPMNVSTTHSHFVATQTMELLAAASGPGSGR